MFGIRFFKAAPTTYVLHYKGGKIKREGAGLSFLLLRSDVFDRSRPGGKRGCAVCLQ